MSRCPKCGKFTADGDFVYPEAVCVSCWLKNTGNKWNQDKMRYEDKDENPL